MGRVTNTTTGTYSGNASDAINNANLIPNSEQIVNISDNINVVPAFDNDFVTNSDNNIDEQSTQQLIGNIVTGTKLKMAAFEYENDLSTLVGKTIKNAANCVVFVKHDNNVTLWVVDSNDCIFPVQTYKPETSNGPTQHTPTNNTQPYYEQQNISESAQEMHI